MSLRQPNSGESGLSVLGKQQVTWSRVRVPIPCGGMRTKSVVVCALIASLFAWGAGKSDARAATSGWSAAKSRTAHGGAFHTATGTGASVVFAVKRRSFALWYVAGPSNGKVAVLVNGVPVRTVDQYAPVPRRKSVALTGAKSVNEVRVVVLSTRNQASRGTKVNVDALSPSASRCAAGCVRNPVPLVQSAIAVTTTSAPPATTVTPRPDVVAASPAEAVWYPSAVPEPSSPEWTVAIGSYVRSRDVKPIDTAVPVIRAAACDQAKKVPRGVVILSFGRQVKGGASGFSTSTITHAEIVATAAAWAAGLAECGTGPWEVSIGTSNSGAVTAFNGFSGGQVWARLVDQARAASDPRVAVTGSVDLEPGWGPPGQARAWVDGYVATTAVRLWNFGSADGCPQSVSTKLTCNNGWTIDDVLWVSSHAGPNVLAMPQIHTQSGSQARQWAVLAARGVALAKPLRLAAITVQTAACSQVKAGCPTTGVSAWDGWAQLRRSLDAIPSTVGTPVGAPMDIRWGWANGFVIPKATTTTTSTSSTTTTTTVPATTTTTSTSTSTSSSTTAPPATTSTSSTSSSSTSSSAPPTTAASSTSSTP